MQKLKGKPLNLAQYISLSKPHLPSTSLGFAQLVSAERKPVHRASLPSPPPWVACTVAGTSLSLPIYIYIYINIYIYMLRFVFDLWLFDFSKGISASALPYKRSSPSWLKISPQDVRTKPLLSDSCICVTVFHFWWVLVIIGGGEHLQVREKGIDTVADWCHSSWLSRYRSGQECYRKQDPPCSQGSRCVLFLLLCFVLCLDSEMFV